jgi:CRISPR-associated protein Cas2
MLELGPGVYSGARINPAVRDRVWKVIEDWYAAEKQASVVMVWADPSMPGGQNVRTLGLPPIELTALDGLLVARRAVSANPTAL